MSQLSPEQLEEAAQAAQAQMKGMTPEQLKAMTEQMGASADGGGAAAAAAAPTTRTVLADVPFARCKAKPFRAFLSIWLAARQKAKWRLEPQEEGDGVVVSSLDGGAVSVDAHRPARRSFRTPIEGARDGLAAHARARARGGVLTPGWSL